MIHVQIVLGMLIAITMTLVVSPVFYFLFLSGIGIGLCWKAFVKRISQL